MNKHNDIIEELKTISPLLLKIKTEEKPLDIPQNYFSELEDNVWMQIREDSGILSQLHKIAVSAPENYFTSLSDKVMHRIHQEAEQKQPLVVIHKKAQKNFRLFDALRKVSIAACVAGILGLGGYKLLHKPEKELICVDGIACLTQDEILQYMQVHSHEFEIEQVKDAVSNTLLNDSLSTPTKVNKKEEKAIEKYLQQDDYSFQDLENTDTDIF